MTRRSLLSRLLATACLSKAARASSAPDTGERSVAITMDDFNLSQAWPDTPARVNRRLLELFERYGIKITLFVAARNVDDENGAKLLDDWSSAGHTIGNHTYSHFAINSPGHTLEDFEEDMLKAERILTRQKTYRRMFRFPALKEGDTVQLRDGMRAFLDARHYRNGYVTIDASDWYYHQRLAAKLHADGSFAEARFEAPYVAHIRDRSLYYDRLACDVLGRSPRHTLLVHFSYLNARFLGSVLAMYRSMGWKLVGSDEAYTDPISLRRPNTLPAGESLIWALAKETGRYDAQLRYPGEDGVYEKPKLEALGL